MQINFPHLLLEEWRPLRELLIGNKDKKSNLAILNCTCLQIIGKIYVNSLPKPIYFKEQGYTIYPSLSDYPLSMQVKLTEALRYLSIKINEYAKMIEDKSSNISCLLYRHQTESLLAFYGSKLINLRRRNGTYVSDLLFAARYNFTKLKIIIELGADVNGITLMNNDRHINKITILWMLTWEIASQKNNKLSFENVALYLRSCGAKIYSTLVENEKQKIVVNRINVIVLQKPLLCFAGYRDYNSIFSLLPKELIQIIIQLLNNNLRFSL